MPKFRKIAGVHYRKENGVEVAYGPDSVIEATEAELRKHDANLTSWKLLDGEISASVEAPIVVNLKVERIEGTKQFNVVNTITNLPINDVPMSRKDAFSLVQGTGV